MSAQNLLVEIKKHLPLRVYGNGPVMEMLRELGKVVNKKTPLTATEVFRDAESGEVVCEVVMDGDQKITAALSNLKLDITHPLYRKVKNYRNEVANELAKPDNGGGINSQGFRMGSLYGKK